MRLRDLAQDVDAPVVYLVPTRGRPQNAVELLDAWDATLSDVPAAALVFAVDDDDTELDRYLELELPEWAELYVGPRRRLGPTLNELAPAFAEARTAVGFMGDDHRPRTRGFDEMLVEAHAATPLAVVYGNDLVRGKALPTAVSLDARIVEVLGYMVPPGAVHLYLDDYWRELGGDLGTLRYVPELVIEHLHPTAGTAEMDAGYAEVNHPTMYRRDEETYRRHMAQRHEADLEQLRQLRAKLHR